MAEEGLPLAGMWLGPLVSTAGGLGSILGQGIRILHGGRPGGAAAPVPGAGGLSAHLRCSLSSASSPSLGASAAEQRVPAVMGEAPMQTQDTWPVLSPRQPGCGH